MNPEIPYSILYSIQKTSSNFENSLNELPHSFQDCFVRRSLKQAFTFIFWNFWSSPKTFIKYKSSLIVYKMRFFFTLQFRKNDQLIKIEKESKTELVCKDKKNRCIFPGSCSELVICTEFIHLHKNTPNIWAETCYRQLFSQSKFFIFIRLVKTVSQ